MVRPGRDLTIVGLGATVHHALDAADTLAADGVDAEVVDLRSLVPLDRATMIESVARTGRLLVVDDDYHSYGVTGEVIATAAEAGVLRSAPRRLGYPDIPVPFSPALEHHVLPNAARVAEMARTIVGGG